jgi:hypothetical protein
LLLHCWLQHTAETPHGDPSATQALDPELDAAALLADDEPAVVLAEPPVVVETLGPVDEDAAPPAVAVLTALCPPCPPEPLPAAPLEKRSSPPRPQAGRRRALARSEARRSEGRGGGIVTEIFALKRPADKGDGDRGARGRTTNPSSRTKAALAAP